MHDAFNWDHIDDIVDVYANAYVYGARQQELERQIVSACNTITRSRPTMHDFTFLLDTGLSGKGVVQRRISWAAQHIFGMRAWMVAPAIYEKRQRIYFCPMIEQLKVLGVPVKPVDVHGFRKQAQHKAGKWTQSAVDAFLVDPVQERIVLVKGFSWSQSKQICRDIRAAHAGLDLFDRQDRPFVRVEARAEAIRALVTTKDLLKIAVPDFDIECHYILIDDADCSWNFQCHDVTEVSLTSLKQAKNFDLDKVPCSRSVRDFRTQFSKDSDFFSQMPVWASSSYLSLVPVDRPARAMMQLMEVFERQETSPDRLITVPASEIADTVERRWSIFYPSNRQRHDLEGCLRSGGFVRRPRQVENDYAITAKGLARMMILKQMYTPSEKFGPAVLLAGIQRQASLWFAAHGRPAF